MTSVRNTLLSAPGRARFASRAKRLCLAPARRIIDLPAPLRRPSGAKARRAQKFSFTGDQRGSGEPPRRCTASRAPARFVSERLQLREHFQVLGAPRTMNHRRQTTDNDELDPRLRQSGERRREISVHANARLPVEPRGRAAAVPSRRVRVVQTFFEDSLATVNDPRPAGTPRSRDPSPRRGRERAESHDKNAPCSRA